MKSRIALLTLLSLLVFSTTLANEINEKTFINLGGEEQYVEIIGTKKTNPVLIFIHGGPGWPQTPSIRAFNSELSKDFTLVVWEQRGAGQSYLRNPNPEGMNFEQFVSDANELTDLMLAKFKKPKLYIAGYSWGSSIGLTLAKRYPEKLHAYIGIGQIVNMARGMEYSQKWIAEKARGEKRYEGTLDVLAKLKNPPKEFCVTQFECFMEQYKVLSKYNGHLYDPKINKTIGERTAKYKDYENYDWFNPFEYSWKRLQFDLEKFDAADIKSLDVPIYLFLGRHDHNIPSVLAADFLKDLKAPKKTLVWIEKAGHGVMEEGGDTFNKLFVQEVIGK